METNFKLSIIYDKKDAATVRVGKQNHPLDALIWTEASSIVSEVPQQDVALAN